MSKIEDKKFCFFCLFLKANVVVLGTLLLTSEPAKNRGLGNSRILKKHHH